LILGETISLIVAVVGSFRGKCRANFDLFGLSVWAEMRTAGSSRANQADGELWSILVVEVISTN
jgi:hypothetical protein